MAVLVVLQVQDLEALRSVNVCYQSEVLLKAMVEMRVLDCLFEVEWDSTTHYFLGLMSVGHADFQELSCFKSLRTRCG